MDEGAQRPKNVSLPHFTALPVGWRTTAVPSGHHNL
jgi:hypothetical protein